MDIKNKIAEIITHTHKTPLEQAEEILQFFAENNESKQLLQSRVVGECEHPYNSTRTCKITEINTCSLCGKQWY